VSLYIKTLAEMKAELGIGDSVDDAVLTAWMEGTQGRMATHCRRLFLEQSSRAEIHDGGKTSLFVRAYPIETLSEVVVDQDQDWTDSANVLASDDYLANHKRGAIVYGRGGSPWPEGYQNIRVTYTGGLVASDGTAANSYVEDEDLQTLKRAFVMQAGFEWRNRETLGITQISQSGAARQVGAGVALALKGITLMPEVQEALGPLRRML